MNSSLLARFTVEKSLLFIVIVVTLLVFVFIFYLFFSYGSKSIRLISPNGGEEWEIGQTYKISWKAQKIEKIGIVLFKDKEAKLIAKNINAELGAYEFEIYPGQEYGPGYWVAVFEYPWQKGSKIDYSDGAFAITSPELANCDWLSLQSEWPFLPSDSPNLRRAFITEGSYTGNLGGLEGADKICQSEAEKQGFQGSWRAFIGGDSDEELALKRLQKTPRKTDGIFIDAKPAGTLIRGATCHRLLAKNFNEFLEKLLSPLIINEQKFERKFLESMGNLWLGRLDERSKKNCVPIAAIFFAQQKALAEKYSFTATCQGWTQEKAVVEGYPVPKGAPQPSFPTCYTPEGKLTDAVSLAGLATGLTGAGSDVVFTPYQGKFCNSRQKLLCIEE